VGLGVVNGVFFSLFFSFPAFYPSFPSILQVFLFVFCFLFRWLAFPFYSLCLVWCMGKANSRKMGKKRGVSAFFFFFFLSFFSLSPTLMQARGFFLYLVWEFFVCALDRSFLSALYSLLSFLLFPFSPSLSLFFFACGVGRTDGGDGDGDGGDGRGENVIKWSVAWVG